MAEDQIGPKSPLLNKSDEQNMFGGANHVDIGASRRIRPGTKAADMAEGPPLVELGEVCALLVSLNTIVLTITRLIRPFN